jgi:hypothetical protein
LTEPGSDQEGEPKEKASVSISHQFAAVPSVKTRHTEGTSCIGKIVACSLSREIAALDPSHPSTRKTSLSFERIPFKESLSLSYSQSPFTTMFFGMRPENIPTILEFPYEQLQTRTSGPRIFRGQFVATDRSSIRDADWLICNTRIPRLTGCDPIDTITGLNKVTEMICSHGCFDCGCPN